jgi:hypothetical protein
LLLIFIFSLLARSLFYFPRLAFLKYKILISPSGRHSARERPERKFSVTRLLPLA